MCVCVYGLCYIIIFIIELNIINIFFNSAVYLIFLKLFNRTFLQLTVFNNVVYSINMSIIDDKNDKKKRRHEVFI